MKILLLGDYSGLHATLARCLSRRGHHVTVISDRGNYMMTDTDICLARDPGTLGSVRYLLDCLSLLPRLRGYDVVQLINPNFLKLKPSKIRFFYDYLRSNNRSVFLTLAGNDYYFVKACIEGKLFRYSEFRIGDKPTSYARRYPEREYAWLGKSNERYARHVYETIDGAMAVLPEYFMSAVPVLSERLSYTGIPVDVDNIKLPPADFSVDIPVTFFVGIKSEMELQKGFDIILPAVKQILDRYPDRCRLKIVRDLPLDKYLNEMAGAHVVIDQLYSYSPATNALMTMASGRVALSGAEPEYYDFIKEKDAYPVVRLNPYTDLQSDLIRLITDRDSLISRSIDGPSFVRRHNDVNIVADRFVAHWMSVLDKY